MKTPVWTKIVFLSVVLGVFAVLFLSAAGFFLIENRLTKDLGDHYYKETLRIAEDAVLVDEEIREDMDAFFQATSYASDFQRCKIWFTDEKGELILPDAGSVPGFSGRMVLDMFKTLEEEDRHYMVGNFYDCFDEDWISAGAKIMSGDTIKGYIVLHYPMGRIYQYRDFFQLILICCLILCYLLGTVPLIVYRSWVIRPLNESLKGIREFTKGNLAYRIPAEQDQDKGYLASSLNFLAEQMDRNGQYQRRLISNISHDFRTPLTSIRGYASAILDGTIPPETAEKYLTIIIHETERLEKLTENLKTLDFLEMNRQLLRFQTFDICAMLRKVAEAFEVTCTEKELRLVFQLPPKPLLVAADPEQIKMVLYNLIENAVKFSKRRSLIQLEAYEQNGKVFVLIKDHGIGISPGSIERIWDRFYKQDNSRGKDRNGSGLGLSIVKEIIDAHGEHINVISTEGIGTEFIFSLQKAAAAE